MDYDLDMQIVEYRHAADDWAQAVLGKNLLANGDMQSGRLDAARPDQGQPDGWKAFAVDAGTVHHYATDGAEPTNRILRVIGGSFNKRTVDGGYVARVTGLDKRETYRLVGRVRSSWPADERHSCLVGHDRTGQTDDPHAGSIEWTTLPGRHGDFVRHRSIPIRPQQDRLSIWLRGRTTSTADAPFQADFDDFQLRRIRTDAPSTGDEQQR
jgi:hypothetical protein